MIGFIRKNLLPLVILAALLVAASAPQAGVEMKSWGLTGVFTMLIFVCQGMGFDVGEARRVRGWFKLSLIGLLTSQALAPLLGLATVGLLGWEGDRQVGFLLICSMAPTLVSGVVIAGAAGGDRPVALFLTIALNLAAIGLIPLNLRWTLGATVPIDPWSLLSKLVLTVLLPGIAGQLLRRAVPRVVRWSGPIAYLPIALLGGIIFMSISSQVDRLRETEWLTLATLIVPSLAVHYLLLIAAWFGGRAAGLSRAVRISLAILCSQKTLPVAIIVWQQQFAQTHPLALIPPIVFHLGQIYGDGLLARRLAAGAKRDAR